MAIVQDRWRSALISEVVTKEGIIMALALDSPIEDLKLSNRVRNVLHLSGLHTVGSVLQCDYTTALRGFGPGARAELACALKSQGLLPPAHLMPSEVDNFNQDVSKLLGEMESTFQKWNVRMAHFETRIRDLTTKGGRFDLNSGTEQHLPAALADQAQEFKTRLTALRIARATLRGLAKFREHPAVVGSEEERLTFLVSRLLEMLPRRNARSLPKLAIPKALIRTETSAPPA